MWIGIGRVARLYRVEELATFNDEAAAGRRHARYPPIERVVPRIGRLQQLIRPRSRPGDLVNRGIPGNHFTLPSPWLVEASITTLSRRILVPGTGTIALTPWEERYRGSDHPVITHT